MQSLIAGFAAELTRKAQAEAPAAQKRFASDPSSFRRWCAGRLQAFREQMTVEAFLQWARETPDELQRAIDAEAPAALRELDHSLLEVGAALEKAYQLEEARRRPPDPDTHRKPPSREELLSSDFMARDQSVSTTFGAISGRTRRTLRRGRV